MQTAREGGHFLKMLSCIASPIFEIRHFPIIKATFFWFEHITFQGGIEDKARREGESQDEPERTASEPKGQKESRARGNRIHTHSSGVPPRPNSRELPSHGPKGRRMLLPATCP